MSNTDDSIKLTDAPLTLPVGDSRYSTTNTKEAVALSTVGVAFKHEFPITNIYTKERHVSRTHPRALPGEHGWQPGVVSYHFDVTDNTAQSIKPLVDAFASGDGDSKFDELMDKLDAKIREEKHLDQSLIELAEEIRKAYRPSIIAHIRRALENRERILDGILKCEEFLKVRAGIGFKFVSKYASRETKKKLGL